MYCPNCNLEFDSKFCPECGTKLVEEPEAKINLNLGRSNAIKGDINLSDSHNVHNEDKSVHNITNTTSTVNNVTNVAAQKTEQELFEERKIQFMEKCKEVFADGILAGQENAALEIERIRLGLDPVIAKQLIEVARHSASFRMDALTPRDSMTLKLITNVLRSNDVNIIKHQLPRLEALSRAYAVDEVQYKYYLVLAALFPEKLVEKYEANTSDEYWKTFWVYIAYLKLGNLEKAERAATRLPLYTQYSDENGMLLSIVGVLNDFGKEAAIDYLNAIMGTYSDVLQLLHHALALAIDPLKAEELKANKSQCAFYLEYIITLESPEARAERLAKEKAEAIEREKAAAHITYTLTLTGVHDELEAMQGANIFLFWTAEQSRKNFAKMPIIVKTTDNLDEAKMLYRKLVVGGMTIQTDAVNGLNEKVDVKFGCDAEDALKIINSILSNIEPETLSTKSKMIAYNYLVELSKDNSENMEISIRTFGICAKIFETSLDPTDDFTYDDALAMIKEQMELEATAQAGNAEAQYKLGNCYINGEFGLEKDYDKAIEWYAKAAEQGHAEAKAMTKPKLEFEISNNMIKRHTNYGVFQIPIGFKTIIRGPIDSHVCGIVKEIVFPDSVTMIGDSAFQDFTNLTSVTIPDSVTEIGHGAFRGCIGLTSITIPDSVTKIDHGAFEGCTGLTSVTIPDSVTKIDYGAFEGCTGLTSVTIPDSVTEIGVSAFRDCTGLTSITIPDSVTKIGVFAFSDCCRLMVKIPKSLTKISVDAFKGCKGKTYY